MPKNNGQKFTCNIFKKLVTRNLIENKKSTSITSKNSVLIHNLGAKISPHEIKLIIFSSTCV